MPISKWRTEKDSERLRKSMETIEINGDALQYRNKEVRDSWRLRETKETEETVETKGDAHQ